MHVAALAVDQICVLQMRKLCYLFFKNWIKKTSFQNKYYGQTYKENLFVCQYCLLSAIMKLSVA